MCGIPKTRLALFLADASLSTKISKKSTETAPMVPEKQSIVLMLIYSLYTIYKRLITISSIVFFSWFVCLLVWFFSLNVLFSHHQRNCPRPKRRIWTCTKCWTRRFWSSTTSNAGVWPHTSSPAGPDAALALRSQCLSHTLALFFPNSPMHTMQ